MKTTQILKKRTLKPGQMTKIAFLVFAATILTLFTGSKVIAQDNNPLRRGEFGIRYMPTFTSIDLKTFNDDVINGSVSMNHGFGVLLGVNLSKNFGIQAELNYYQVTQKFRDLDLSNKVNVKYLNIPLLLSINTNKERRVNLNFVAGPQFGINAGAKITSTGTENPDNVSAVVAIKKADVGFAYGAGLEFAINSSHTIRLDLGYRGFYGLVDINSSKTDNDTYNVVAKASRKTNAAYAGLTFLF